jgi:FtsZ-binding cell division protein ZapB
LLQTNPLIELTAAHTGKYSDKWESYLHSYWTHLQAIKDSSSDILEIGIQNGGSLEIWSKFFPKVNQIIGYDNDPKCGQLRFDDPRIKVFVGDASSKEAEVTVKKTTSNLGLVIDDGSHKSGDIIRSFLLFFPQLNPGGIFIIEDLHASYWADWEGGLSDPNSSMQFLKLLADVVNFDHWGIQAKRTDLFDSISATYGLIDQDLLSEVDSVTFSDSLCIIRKKDTNASGLGMRVGSGIQAEVEPLAAASNGSFMISPSQENNPFADPKDLSLKRSFDLKNENQDLKNENQDLKNENQDLKNENQDLKNENQDLKNENQDLKNEMAAVLETLSWRITLPLRKIRRLISSFPSKDFRT